MEGERDARAAQAEAERAAAEARAAHDAALAAAADAVAEQASAHITHVPLLDDGSLDLDALDVWTYNDGL